MYSLHERLKEGLRWFEIRSKNGQTLIVADEKLGEKITELMNIAYKQGIIAGMTRFAWWKDGEEYVGTCGTKLKQAIEEL